METKNAVVIHLSDSAIASSEAIRPLALVVPLPASAIEIEMIQDTLPDDRCAIQQFEIIADSKR
jgi:hypothetical protein